MSHYDESQSERLARKARDAPFMVAGLAGLVGLVGYSIYGFKNKKIKTSVYLIHTRVAAQGFVVACLTAGVSWNLFKNHIYPRLYPEAVEEKKNQISHTCVHQSEIDQALLIGLDVYIAHRHSYIYFYLFFIVSGHHVHSNVRLITFPFFCILICSYHKGYLNIYNCK